MLPGRKVIQSSLQTILVINDVNLTKKRGGLTIESQRHVSSNP